MRQKISRILSYLGESSWVAYAAIFLLQVKVMLYIWEYRDLTEGDTSYYYVEVFNWLDKFKGSIVWSPIYTGFLAILHRLLGVPFWVLIVTQIFVATSASIIILSLMRRLLPKHLAWVIAAWWVVLPINFDTVYNVHLFSALFPLALFVIAAYVNNIYGRGIVLGGLLFTAVLLRNEYGALFLLWLLALGGYEIYRYHREEVFPSRRTIFFAYGAPLFLVVFLIGVFFARSVDTYPKMKKSIEVKHTLNVCQIYAFNRKQQGDSWKGNPWTDCDSIIKRDFGRTEVTFSQAFFLNPRAILRHIWWNIKLIPSGTQLALFNYYAGGPNPDYLPAKRAPLVWVPFLLVLGFSGFAVVAGIVVPVLRKRQSFKDGFAWLFLSSAALLALGVMIMQRPRPSYMFPYTLFLMALTGLGLDRLLELVRVDKAVKAWWPLCGILLILIVPSHYDADYVGNFGYKGQPFRQRYERLAPYINRYSLDSPAEMITPLGDIEILCNYLGINCTTRDMEGDISAAGIKKLTSAFPGENVYLSYLENMIWNVNSLPNQKKRESLNYIKLDCFSQVNNVMTCSDGTVDLGRGVMNDGRVDIPLRAVLFVNDGHVLDQKNYGNEQGYYLQVLMRKGILYMILVADERLFRTNFNQQYLLGNYDRRYFEEVYDDFPMIRVLKVKEKREANRRIAEPGNIEPQK